MPRFAAVLAFAAIAAPALAQQPADPTASQGATEIDAAAQAFNNCIGINAQRADPETTPEVAAAAVLATCAPHRRRLENEAEMMIAALPPERRSPARERLRTSLGSAEAQIAEVIRQQRGEAPHALRPGN